MRLTSVGSKVDKVRIGPVSLITLIVVICMAVLAVLTASTAHATLSISQRQAEATSGLYENERAAQELVANVDDALAALGGGISAQDGASALDAALDGICEKTRSATGETVGIEAEMDGLTLKATFTNSLSRRLNVEITVLDGGAYRIDRWKSAGQQQEAQGAGTLWMGN